MFEEIKELHKIDLEFMKLHGPCFKDLLNLSELQFLDFSVIKDYLSFSLESHAKEEALILSILISNDKEEIKELLGKLASEERDQKNLVNSSMWLILKWFEQTSKLPRGFDLVELCNDLVVHFNFPELEKKLLYQSLADWEILESNLQTYLCEKKVEEGERSTLI